MSNPSFVIRTYMYGCNILGPLDVYLTLTPGMGVWRNGSASDFDCRSPSEGCSFEYCHAHFFPFAIYFAARFHLILRRAPVPTTAILHVRPTTATTTGWWPIRIHDTRFDIHQYQAIWLDDSATIWRWSLWRHSKPT